MKAKYPLTLFGRTVRDLMESRGHEEWTELADALKAGGWPGSRTTLSKYMRGKHPVHPSFISHLVKTLDLNEEEKRRLASAYAFGQGF